MTQDIRITVDYDQYPDYSWLDQPEFADDDKSRHTLLTAVVERRCPHCGQWEVIDSCGGIDMYVDDDYPIGTFTAEQLRKGNENYEHIAALFDMEG